VFGADFALARFVAGMLFGVAPTAPATFAIAAFVVAAVALIACAVRAQSDGDRVGGGAQARVVVGSR
jgi:hypothetical protein